MRRPPIIEVAGAALGTGLVAVGANLAWATFFFGYPGKVTLAGFPGGARLYCLVLLAVTPLVFIDAPGRRRAGLSGGIGIVAIAGGNLLVIAKNGGGLGAVAVGAWLTVTGGVLLTATFWRGAERASTATHRAARATGHRRRLAVGRTARAVFVILGSLVGLLELIVYGLNVGESTLFVSLLALMGFAAVAAQRLGLLTRLVDLHREYRALSLITAAAVAFAFPFTQHGSSYWIRVLASVGVFAAAAIGLNVVVGLAGLLDLGYVAFFGVGAYVAGLFANARLTTVHIHVPFPIVILLGASIAATFGVIIGAPTLRLRGDYLAIVTLGFGEIFRITAQNWDGLTRGPNGISDIPNLKISGFDFGDTHRWLGVSLPGFSNYYFMELLLLVAVIIVFTRLNTSRIGRAWIAIREDETAAAAMGVNTVRLKLLAFAIGAFLAGAAGTMNAHLTGQVSPDSYTFLESILLVAAVVLGGMGTVVGALIGSTLLFVIPEKLRSFQDKRLLLFGLALILMMRFRPEGIAANRRRQRELHDGSSTGAMGAAPGAPVAPA